MTDLRLCFFKEDAEKERLSYNCFPEIASVRLEGGRTKTMKELKIGDKVAAMDTSGRIVYSRVVTFLDSCYAKVSKFN